MTRAQRRALERDWPRFGIEGEGPLDLDSLFGRRAPRIVEVGFGMGDALLELASAHPDRDFLGVEVYAPGVGSLLARLAERDLGNVRVMREDVLEVLASRIPDGALDAVLVYFPDPWPKKRHVKRRLVQSPFLALVHRVLEPRGRFELATDVEPYARQMLEVVEADGGFVNLAGSGRFSARPTYRPVTKFERRGERLGHRVFDLVFTRAVTARAVPAAGALPA
jgi:tRNA (guanine-N7-)-methyltransferase